LLSERNFHGNLIGYARAIESEADYLNEQIICLRDFGCSLIFSEILSLNENDKPQLKQAFKSLSKGDELVLMKLDRAFKSKYECIQKINNFLKNGIHLRTLSGFLYSTDSYDVLPAIFNVLYELDNLEINQMNEQKKEIFNNRKIFGKNLGGRPKLAPLKESLVLRLRNDGFSYRSIRSQTGIALSTIRRIILDSEAQSKLNNE